VNQERKENTIRKGRIYVGKKIKVYFNKDKIQKVRSKVE
jgi:hypothetical protein